MNFPFSILRRLHTAPMSHSWMPPFNLHCFALLYFAFTYFTQNKKKGTSAGLCVVPLNIGQYIDSEIGWQNCVDYSVGNVLPFALAFVYLQKENNICPFRKVAPPIQLVCRQTYSPNDLIFSVHPKLAAIKSLVYFCSFLLLLLLHMQRHYSCSLKAISTTGMIKSGAAGLSSVK